MDMILPACDSWTSSILSSCWEASVGLCKGSENSSRSITVWLSAVTHVLVPMFLTCKSCNHCLWKLCLEWSKTKSDCNFGFIILKNHPRQNSGAIRTTSAVWKHIAIFAWRHMRVIFNPNTIKVHIKRIYFTFFHLLIISKKFLCNVMSHILNQYPIIDFYISWNRKLLPKIMPVLYVIICAASQNNMHMSSSENCKMLPKATRCPNRCKNLHKWFFTCWIQIWIWIQICSLTTPGIQDLKASSKIANDLDNPDTVWKP